MITTKLTKAVIYCRVSSREQELEGYSLPAQTKFLKEYAEKNSFKVVKVFAVSESAMGKVRRKIFNEMIDYVRKNNISVIIVETTDRLTRNFADVPIIDKWILENENNQIHLAKEGCVLNKNSKSHEWFMWRVKVATAEYYVRLLSENVKKGQKEKLAQGWLPTKPPLAYQSVGEKGRRIHVVDETKAPLIKKAFELYATGNYSLKELVRVMHKEGLRNKNGRKVDRSRIHELLSDPFYIGKIRWKGEIYNGQHPPLISVDLFDAVQSKLKRKIAAPQYKKHLPVFKAKIKCEECGGLITWEIQRGHWYGHCNHYKNCSQKTWVRQEEIEEQLFPHLEKVAPKNERTLDWLEKALKESHADKIDYATKTREELNRRYKRIEKRLEEMYEDKLDKRITIDFYERKFKEYSDEKDSILESLQKHEKANRGYYELGVALHELAYKAKDVYLSQKAVTEDRRLLLSYAFSNITLNEGKITPNYTLAFDFLANWMPILNKNFEQSVLASKKAKSDLLGVGFRPKLPILDAFRIVDWKKVREDLRILSQNVLSLNKICYSI